ncbi:hypothetical protein MNBD_NITROSPINAE02-1816, partial [hydrothermal vent metagenome]
MFDVASCDRFECQESVLKATRNVKIQD